MALLPYAGEERSPQTGEPQLNVARMIANATALREPVRGLTFALLGSTKLDPVVRELAILRMAQLAGASYVWTQHRAIAERAGVSAEQIEALAEPADAPCFDELQRLAIRLAREMHANVKGDPATVAALRRHLDAERIVELVIAIGHYGMVARLTETLEVDLEDWAGRRDPHAGMTRA